MNPERKAKGALSDIILDEIGLDGLEGLTLEGLWTRISEALSLTLPLHDWFKNEVWDFIKTKSDYIEFYELPEPREKLKTFDRFKFVNPDSGFPIVPDECPETRYKLFPIQKNEIIGSCQFFHERKLISFAEINILQLQNVIEKYGEKFVIVGKQDFRESILYPENISKPDEITKQQYCLLEIIARSRYNGEKTAGKYSLQPYCKDSADLFYIRNKLLSQNLIVKQPYTETMCGRAISAYLLTLPRFFIQHKTKPVAIIESIFNILQNEPDQKMEYDKLKSFLAKDYKVYLKKLQLTHIFRKFFEIFKAPYRTIFPDAPRNLWKLKNVDREKQLLLIRLKDKNITLENIFNEENFVGSGTSSIGGDSTETDKVEFITAKHFYIDMPYIEQVYRLIDKQGSVGCNQSQLQRYLGLERLTVRGLIKQVVKTGLITHYWQDFGRQKTIMYVARHHSKDCQSTNLESKNDVGSFKCHDIKLVANTINNTNDIPAKLEEPDGNKTDINEDILTNINATVKDISLISEVTGSLIILKHPTLRQVQRQKMIVSTVNDQIIIDKITMRNKIIAIEKSEGYKDQICTKSLNRIINWLAKKNIIKVYEITLEMRKCVRIYRYIVHPKLDPNHELLQEEIIKLKNQLHLNIEEREMRELGLAKKYCHKENSTSNSVYSNFYRRAPKFLTCRFFHEFVYYLVYEMDPETEPISSHENITKMLVESSPQYDLNNLTSDLQTCYNDNLSWKMFIPPLQRSSDKPYGWAYIMDIFTRIPLSLLMKLYQIDRNSNKLLNEYLNHPVKQHYLLQKLPSDLQDFIFKLRVGKTCLNFFKILNLIGLVQLGKRNQKDPKESWFYLNRKAKLFDTSISEPGYRLISLDKEYQEYNYTFDTFQEVQNYWNFLYKTCCLTRLGVRIDVQQKKRQEPAELLPVEFEMAPEKDIGYIPGDFRGAGGLDSLMFAHLKSNWSWSVKLAKKKMSVKTSVLGGQRIKLGDLNTNKKLLKNITEVTKRKITLTTTKKIPIKRRIKSTTACVAKSKRCKDYDEIDRDALTRMDSLRVQWNKDEDNLLKVCRAVFIYLKNSVSQLHRVINAHNYRDILHWALNSRNKTSKACQRRILYIFKKHHNTDISAWVHELKRNRHIKQRFGTKFIDDLRKIYPDDITFSEALKVYFVQLVYYLNKIIKNANLSIENECILPDTLMQFNRFYKECPNVSPAFKDDDIKHFDPKTIEDIEVSTINSLMHSTMCCNRDKTLYNIQIFEIYKNFKEEILSKAFKKARDDCLVVGTKGFRNSVSSVTGPSFVLSVKYRQALYLNIPYEILAKCYETFEIFLIKFFSNKRTKETEEESTIDFKTINSGVFYLLTEMSAQNRIKIDIQMPQKILTIDPTQQQNVNDSERILDHFRQIFDNAPKHEYLKIFEAENNNSDGKAKPRVKFNIANQNYKLNYNPYNILSKLSDDYLHFFCALDHLNKIIDLDFTRFTADNFCPFSNCILKNSNFITGIERIIHEKKSIIEDLLRTSENEEIIENIVILNQKNIMQIYYKLQDALRLRNRLLNLKDYGKMRTNFQLNYLNILKLCKDIMEYKDTDEKKQIEYEPTLNKEEKIIRAHDIFVVNLPTLKVSLNDTEFINSEIKEYKDNLIPQKLIQSDIQRETILKKVLGFSIWSHFGSVDKLRGDEIFKLCTTSMQSFIMDVLSFIHTFPLGATTNDLVEQFKDELNLVSATIILRKHYLIMRVGIENFIYVHKNYISTWVIQTYHIKRLEKESLQRCHVTLVTKNIPEIQKRKIASTENEDLQLETATKKLKTNEGEKRISKPVDRFMGASEPVQTKIFTPKEKETIIIRPCPWIRINGSLNRRVLDRWLGCIVIDCLSNCGQTIRKLCRTFNQMHPVNLMCLLEILQDLNCINLRVSKPQKLISLFTKYENNKEEVATEFSKMDEVFITTTPNAIINIALFIGDKKYITDFI